MAGIMNRRRSRRNFIPGLLLALGILSLAGGIMCSIRKLTEATIVKDDQIVENKPDMIAEKIKSALLPEEALIDWVQDASDFYVLVHSEGNMEYGDTFLLLSEAEGALTRTYENDFQELMPWKIARADVDGDREQELLIAVRKTTPYDKVLKNRMFIFNYREGVLVKKWTGSQIAGTWRDFYAKDLVDAPGDELIFLEQLAEEKEGIKVYHWFDFGFFLLAESDAYTKVKEVTVTDENRLLITLDEGKQISLIMRKGKLVEAKK